MYHEKNVWNTEITSYQFNDQANIATFKLKYYFLTVFCHIYSNCVQPNVSVAYQFLLSLFIYLFFTFLFKVHNVIPGHITHVESVEIVFGIFPQKI